MNNFQEEVKKMPTDIQDIFLSQKSSELNSLLCEKHKIKEDDIVKNTFLITDLFFKKIKLASLVDEIKKLFGFTDEQARQMAIDIAGIRLLIAGSWIDGDVEQFIKDMGTNPEDYRHYVEEQKEAVIKEKEEYEAEMAEDKAPLKIEKRIAEASKKKGEFNEAKEIKDSVDLFEKDVIKVISTEKGFIEPYNDVLIKLLVDRGATFKKQLENALFSNQEKIASEILDFKGRKIKPTIANWLKYFIKKKGAGIFDMMVLSGFLANDENAKKLTHEEKKLLSEVLRLYRNLKFFPDSMPNKTGEGWEIIPIVSEAEVSKVKVVGVPSTKEEREKKEAKEKVELAIEKEKFQSQDTVREISPQERAKKEEEDKVRAKILELEKMMLVYPLKSLERKVVEEEIKKLKTRSKK